jgi:hypothetical protein
MPETNTPNSSHNSEREAKAASQFVHQPTHGIGGDGTADEGDSRWQTSYRLGVSQLHHDNGQDAKGDNLRCTRKALPGKEHIDETAAYLIDHGHYCITGKALCAKYAHVPVTTHRHAMKAGSKIAAPFV